MSGYRKNQKRIKRKKPLSHGWIVVPSKSYRDRVYFYNIVTKCSSWINPCEVLDDETSSKNSSDTSVELKNHSSTVYQPKKRTSGESFFSFAKENHETEDCDQYFDKGADSDCNIFNSISVSPRDSPDSTFSFKTNKSDSDSSKNNMSFENDKKELWLHFASTPKKNNWKKSLALSDFDQPSTSSKTENDKQLLMWDSHNEDSKESKNRGGIKSKKKKRSRKSEGGIFKKEAKRSGDKIIENMHFMMKDKTPAQTGILKFRREYAEKIKKILDSSTPFKSKGDKNKNFNASCSSGPVECLEYANYNDHSRQSTEVHNEQISHNDLSEEMDWEPSSEESDVRNINEFRLQQGRGQTSSNIFCELNGYQKTTLPSQMQELVIVLDTNIFVSCLNFVRELRDTKIGDSSYPIIYVPWRVLQELDHLKDSKFDGANRQLSLNVRKAISFLNENFKFKHPRVFGQSFEDFNNMMDFNSFAPDDEILQTCIQLKKRHLEIKLVLLTNDKNLESKANVSGVKVFSKESFEKTYMNPNSLSPSHTSSSKVIAAGFSVQIDNYVCQIKAFLKEFISIIVETEMRIAFEEDWIRVIHKKPPWTTREALICFLKHWRSVFFLIFSKMTLIEAENLYEKLFMKEPASMEDINEIISVFQRFIKSIILSQKKKRPYLDLGDGLMAKLFSLSKEIPLNDVSQGDGRMSEAPVPPFLTCNESFTQAQTNTDEITPLDISKVKNLFRDIWESLRCFCCSMSDVVNSPSPGSNTSLAELRLKLVQILKETGELISSLEKIFEINLPDINERHPLIIQFSHFLSNLYPAINLDVQNKLPKCLAVFFTDYEGRSLLSRSLTDFREFSQELIKTSEFFKAHFQ